MVVYPALKTALKKTTPELLQESAELLRMFSAFPTMNATHNSLYKNFLR